MGIPVQEQCLCDQDDRTLPDDAILYQPILLLHSPIHIKVLSLVNPSIDMSLIPPWSISGVKIHIEQYIAVAAERQQLVCDGYVLENNKHVYDYIDIFRKCSNIIVQKKYTVTLHPSNVSLSITDHHSVADIKRLIQQQLQIPQRNQVLFMHSEFQQNDQQTFPNPESNVDAYVVDNRDRARIIAIDLPNQPRFVYLLDKPSTDLSLKKLIERDFGYAIEAQNLKITD